MIKLELSVLKEIKLIPIAFLLFIIPDQLSAQDQYSDTTEVVKYLHKGSKAIRAIYGPESTAGLKYHFSEIKACMAKFSIDFYTYNNSAYLSVYMGLIYYLYMKTDHEMKPFIGFGPQLGVLSNRSKGINHFDFSIYPGIEWFLFPKFSITTEYQIKYWREWDNDEEDFLDTGFRADFLKLGLALYLN